MARSNASMDIEEFKPQSHRQELIPADTDNRCLPLACVPNQDDR